MNVSTAADRMGGRELKRFVVQRLLSADVPATHAELCRLPARRVVSPLFGLFCDPNPLVRWRAVTAMGAVVSRLAEADLESARVVVRRLMWNLNEESGGIGWGCPEAMGEILARCPSLAQEYGRIFTSYLSPGGNYLEYPAIQQGVLWGFGRLARAHAGRMAACAALLLPFLDCEDAARRGLAAWAAGALGAAELLAPLDRLSADAASFEIYEEERLERCTVGAAARAGASRIRAVLAEEG